MPVNINLSDAGMWNTYGVAGFGVCRYFVHTLGEPSGFPYQVTSATGFGGVLLIGGMDPFTGDTEIPLAYDMSCPVECRSDVRVRVDESTMHAVCGVCGSVYDVTMRGGAPVSGTAAERKPKLGLTRYRCYKTITGGYLIGR